MGFLISVVGVRLHTYPCSTHNNGRLLFERPAKAKKYQIRGWLAWHHHIALVMLSMLFVLTEKIAYKNEHPLLSARDVREIIARTYAENEDVMLSIKDRHKRRQDDIDSRYRKIAALKAKEGLC